VVGWWDVAMTGLALTGGVLALTREIVVVARDLIAFQRRRRCHKRSQCRLVIVPPERRLLIMASVRGSGDIKDRAGSESAGADARSPGCR